MPQRTPQRGFTLVELITVIVILGVVASFALPRLTDRSAFQARGFEDEMLAALRYARSLAVASGCPVQVSIAGNGYILNQQQAGCAPGSCVADFTRAVLDPATLAPTYVGTAPAGITLGGPASFVFDSRGEASAALCSVPANVTLTLGGNANRTITVFGSTGFAQQLP